MLTKEEIKNKLAQDPDWSPDYDASDEEWDLYDAVLDDMEPKPTVAAPTTDDGEDDATPDWDDDFEDDEDF